MTASVEVRVLEAWVLTDDDNAAARALYSAAGGDDGSSQRMISFRLAD